MTHKRDTHSYPIRVDVYAKSDIASTQQRDSAAVEDRIAVSSRASSPRGLQPIFSSRMPKSRRSSACVLFLVTGFSESRPLNSSFRA